MKTIYYTASSLDGYIADSENSLEWLFQFPPPGAEYQEFASGIGALVMGSTTYQWVLRHLNGQNGDRAQLWPHQQPVWVFTSRVLAAVEGADIRFTSGDVATVYPQIVASAGGKNVWLMGGGDLVGQFHDRGLLDQIIVHIAPVTLGGGAPLLPRAITKPPLRLVSAKAVAGAFAELRYEVQHPE